MHLRPTGRGAAGTLDSMATSSDQPRPPRAHRRIARAVVGVTASLSLIVAAASAYAYVGYLQAQSSIGTIPVAPSSPGGVTGPDFGPCVDNVCNYLILGSDSRAGLSADEQNQFGTNQDIGGSNRSDVIMLVHTDPNLQKAIVLSFPRDLWVNIPGRGSDKINAAFSGGLEGGGAQLVAKTVEDLSGLKINHVLYVDLAGFQGIVQALGGVTMCIPTAMTDPLTGLDVKAGCQTLDGYQALAYVRTRHQPCDLVPDFARISRQQQFLRAVLNRILTPSEIVKAPALIPRVARNLVTTKGFELADVIYLVKQLEGISTGAVEFRAVPGIGGFEGSLSVLFPDPVDEQIFARIRQGKPLGDLGQNLVGTAPSEASIVVPVVDHDSGGTAARIEQILSDSGFDISGIVDYATYGADVKGSVIAYKPGHESEAQVVQKYFPNLPLLEVKDDTLKGSPVAVVVTGGFQLQPVGSGGGSTDCIAPEA
jgi:LCP family protein required for cell wall assembly